MEAGQAGQARGLEDQDKIKADKVAGRGPQGTAEGRGRGAGQGEGDCGSSLAGCRPLLAALARVPPLCRRVGVKVQPDVSPSRSLPNDAVCSAQPLLKFGKARDGSVQQSPTLPLITHGLVTCCCSQRPV